METLCFCVSINQQNRWSFHNWKNKSLLLVKADILQINRTNFDSLKNHPPMQLHIIQIKNKKNWNNWQDAQYSLFRHGIFCRGKSHSRSFYGASFDQKGNMKMRIKDTTIRLYIIIIHKNKDQKALHSFIVDIGFTLQKAMNATMQCSWRGPALSMHIVNFSSKRAPILCKFTCIH